MPRSKKHFETLICQQRIFLGLVKRHPDRLAPKGAEVVLEFGSAAHNLLADVVACAGIGKQRCGHGCVAAQPGAKRGFGLFYHRPDRPQGVIKIEGYGFDNCQVEHR